MKFEERRRVIQALRAFEPSKIEDEKEPPVELLIVTFLAFVGTLSIVYLTGVIIINLF
jgi:hypothetical protein